MLVQTSVMRVIFQIVSEPLLVERRTAYAHMVIVDDGGDGRWRPVVPNGEVLDVETARFVQVANLGTNDAVPLPSKE